MADDWRAEISQLIEDNGLQMKTVSQRAGLSDTFVRDMLKRGREPSASNLAAVRAAIATMLAERQPSPGRSEARLADVPMPGNGRAPRDVPVMGTAAGAAIGKGAFTLSNEPVDYVVRPPGLMAARGVYALFVENDSMSPRFEHGELIYVNPFRPYSVGDYVVIQEPAPTAEDGFNAFVKQFVRKTPNWIVAGQFNPKAELQFKNTSELRVHKVMTWNDLFGV